jgi:hypothetical protein
MYAYLTNDRRVGVNSAAESEALARLKPSTVPVLAQFSFLFFPQDGSINLVVTPRAHGAASRRDSRATAAALRVTSLRQPQELKKVGFTIALRRNYRLPPALNPATRLHATTARVLDNGPERLCARHAPCRRAHFSWVPNRAGANETIRSRHSPVPFLKY